MNSAINIKEEELLLISLCRLDFNDEHVEKVRQHFYRVSDWKNFAHLANEHGVAALAWRNLDNLGLVSGMPEDIATFLRCANLRSLGRNTYNMEAMREALQVLNSENIKTVILKGLALEISVYGNAGLRQMTDVDILVKRDESLKARKIMLGIGYESLPVKSVLHELIIEYTGKHLPSLIKKGTSIEIHQELFGGKNYALTELLYGSSYETILNGEKTWFPAPLYFFLYLIKHLSLHELNNESQLRLYTDLVVLIERYKDEIINTDLLKHATDADMTVMLANHLEPLRKFWGITFPVWINEFIDKWHNTEFNDQFIFFLGSPKGNSPGDKPSFYRHVVSDIPGFHRKVIYVLGDIFPSFRFMKNRYGCESNWQALLYYPHRIGKVFWLLKKVPRVPRVPKVPV